MTSTTAGAGFKWLDILEKEFDKSYVGLDSHLDSVLQIMREENPEEALPAYEAQRKLLTNMAQCFVQLTHKSQTIAQSNAKLEAELIHCREEMSKAKATAAKADAEKNYLICCLQSALLENHRLKAVRPEKKATVTANGMAGNGPAKEDDEDAICSGIQMRLAGEMAAIQKVDWDAKRLEVKCSALERDLAQSKQRGVELESELVGARLDAKYLDKELAGRIQQIQILLASNTSQDHKQKVWSQIETEMHLQRSKTISNMCYSKQKVRDATTRPASSSSNAEEKKSMANGDVRSSSAAGNEQAGCAGANSRDPRLKQVFIQKHDTDELGMAILGGKEHGLPIIISEVFPDSSVSRSGKIIAGDVILAVNGDSFAEFSHNDAVRYLSSLRGAIRFELENTIEADIDKVCDMDSRYYDFHQPTEAVETPPAERPEAHSASSQNHQVTPDRQTTATPDHSRQRSVSSTASSTPVIRQQQPQRSSPETDLPRVHTSPAKVKTVDL